MAQSHEWRGASKNTYSYSIHDRGSLPERDQIGNYVFAKLTNGEWNAIYVGQGNLRECHQSALGVGCVQLKAASHFHYHLNENEKERLAEEKDLLDGHAEAHAPGGCNLADED